MDVLRMSVDRKVCWVYVTDSVARMRITKQNSGDGVARERERERERESWSKAIHGTSSAVVPSLSGGERSDSQAMLSCHKSWSICSQQ
jgi:hypothetical protein